MYGVETLNDAWIMYTWSGWCTQSDPFYQSEVDLNF